MSRASQEENAARTKEKYTQNVQKYEFSHVPISKTGHCSSTLCACAMKSYIINLCQCGCSMYEQTNTRTLTQAPKQHQPMSENLTEDSLLLSLYALRNANNISK